MARTRLGLAGSAAAYSPFAAKSEGSVVEQMPRASRYRGGSRVNYVRGWLLIVGSIGMWARLCVEVRSRW
jgi:hypothetical protein